MSCLIRFYASILLPVTSRARRQAAPLKLKVANTEKESLKVFKRHNVLKCLKQCDLIYSYRKIEKYRCSSKKSYGWHSCPITGTEEENAIDR